MEWRFVQERLLRHWGCGKKDGAKVGVGAVLEDSLRTDGKPVSFGNKNDASHEQGRKLSICASSTYFIPTGMSTFAPFTPTEHFGPQVMFVLSSASSSGSLVRVNPCL